MIRVEKEWQTSSFFGESKKIKFIIVKHKHYEIFCESSGKIEFFWMHGKARKPWTLKVTFVFYLKFKLVKNLDGEKISLFVLIWCWKHFGSEPVNFKSFENFIKRFFFCYWSYVICIYFFVFKFYSLTTCFSPMSL